MTDSFEGRMPAKIEALQLELENVEGGDPLLRILVKSVLLLVDATDNLAYEVEMSNEHAEKTAKAIDYISDHLNEVGQ